MKRLPSGLYVLTSAFENARLGVVVHRVVQCADEPLSVCVALRKGHAISPIIRDSHAFALCAMDDRDKLLLRKFEWPGDGAGGPGLGDTDPAAMCSPLVRDDPFISLDTETLSTGSPLLKRCRFALDCRVSMHLDFESDHELYLAQVVGGRVYE